jgi:hypothetical protein
MTSLPREPRARRIRSLAGLLGLAALLLVPVGISAAGAAHPGSAVAAPSSGTFRLIAPAPTPTTGGAPVVAPHGEGTVAPSPAASAPRPAVPAAPGVDPAWGSPFFFNDVHVTFSLPYVGSLDTFSTVPFTNTLPQAANGFWMNITTDKPIIYANVSIWGTQWPVQNRTAPISGYDSSQPAIRPMFVNTTQPYRAAFFFNNFRYFWPGSTVYFNLSVTAINSTPATIYSAQGQYAFPFPAGCGVAPACDYATWIFYVQGPWISPDFGSSVQIATSPDVLDQPAYDPNPSQTLNIYLTAMAPPNQSFATIPAAQLSWTVVSHPNGETSYGNYSQQFVATNHSTVRLSYAIGPYPNSTVFFNITLWLPWGPGAIDRLYSPTWEFNWSTHGTWASPNQPLAANLELTTVPNILPPAVPTVGVATPVNITIHETQENITISSAQVNFIFQDGQGTHSGVLAMRAETANTSYAVIPGLPPRCSFTFYVSAKDWMGDPVFSQNYTYASTSDPDQAFPANHEMFFVEALDIAGPGLVPQLNFTIQNATWSETRDGTVLGFAAPLTPFASGYFTLNYGSYLVSISFQGRTYSAALQLENQTPFTVLFYVASSAVNSPTTSAVPVVPLAAVTGLGGASLALIIILPWFVDRRRRAEAEQRRITL